MKLQNIHGFRSFREFAEWKLEQFAKDEKNFATLYKHMFSERGNVIAECSDGYRIKKITYGECADKIDAAAPSFTNALSFVPKGEMIGLHMGNSVEWLQAFWAILKAGYRPLLLNMRLSDEVLEKVITDYAIKAVISDGKEFSVKTLNAFELLNATAEGEYVQGEFGKEIIFMSSGTTNSVKLCAYTAENFYYQMFTTVDIAKNCPELFGHYEGELKHLALLPLYHVFGFIAMYVWFGFVARTFVFLKDMHPQTLLNTIKKHKVTHIFAVPLVWNTVYNSAIKKIQSKGEKTYNKFVKASRFVNATGKLGDKFAKKALKEVRDGLFGDSIQFMITGGSIIQPEVLEFFNGIGYRLANGFGMTEVGITSVEMLPNKKILNSGSIGVPFELIEYARSDKGELLIRGKTMATRIIQDGVETVTDFDEYYNSHDLVSMQNGRHYIGGRKDDLVVCSNGENLNPVIIEKELKTLDCDNLCLFADKEGKPVLLVSVVKCYSPEKLQKIYDEILENVRRAKLQDEIKKVVLTTSPLLAKADFKLSRKKIAIRYAAGEFNLINTHNVKEYVDKMLSELECEIRKAFAEALDKQEEEISVEDDFFTDLAGSSLDYFTLSDIVKQRYNVDISAGDGVSLSTVKAVCEFIAKK